MCDSASSKWVNADTIPDNLLFVKDDVDGTKKFQFQLSGITLQQVKQEHYQCQMLLQQ